MKTIKIAIACIVLGFSSVKGAQEAAISKEPKEDKMSYYQKRALEDAKYEQQYQADTKVEDEDFWEEQKAYEKELKSNDRKAYKAYMQGKRDAYQEHYSHCNNHCHHSDYYYHHATFYYYGYNRYYYERRPSSIGISTSTRIGTPSVRLGLF
jgi:hypothetical protein